MTKVSISQAAKMAGVSRAHFYKKYLKGGIVSSIEEYGKTKIDTSELVRVFGLSLDLPEKEKEQLTELDSQQVYKNIHKLTAEKDTLDTTKDDMIEMLKEQISDLKQNVANHQKREIWLQEMLEKMQLQNQALLPGLKKKWWRFW